MASFLKLFLKGIMYALASLLVIVAILLAFWYKSDIAPEENVRKYATPQSEFIRVRDANVHIRKMGSGPTVFLIHGSFASLHTWEDWQRVLSSNYTTISMDLPGHGLTGPNESSTYHTDYYSSLLWSLADSLKIDTLSIAGNSMGGRVAYEMALKQPERVRKLILVDASGAYPLPADTLSQPEKKFQKPSGFNVFSLLKNPLASGLLTKISPKFLFEMSLKQVYHDPEQIKEGTLERYYDLILHEGNRQATIKRFGQNSESRFEQLKNLKAPTLIMWGADDQWIKVKNAHYFHTVLPNSDLKIYEKAGHVPHEEIGLKTAEDALDFLKE